jgi:Cu-Zn family superoxide dismutase
MQVPNNTPTAVAHICGSRECPGLRGTAFFYQFRRHVMIKVLVQNLPQNSSGFYGLHIHSGSDCTDPEGHYNPEDLPHPRHRGDLPPLLSCGGRAYLCTITNRFCLKEIIGRTIVVHREADDFKSQPSGDPGPMIGCGKICCR